MKQGRKRKKHQKKKRIARTRDDLVKHATRRMNERFNILISVSEFNRISKLGEKAFYENKTARMTNSTVVREVFFNYKNNFILGLYDLKHRAFRTFLYPTPESAEIFAKLGISPSIVPSKHRKRRHKELIQCPIDFNLKHEHFKTNVKRDQSPRKVLSSSIKDSLLRTNVCPYNCKAHRLVTRASTRSRIRAHTRWGYANPLSISMATRSQLRSTWAKKKQGRTSLTKNKL